MCAPVPAPVSGRSRGTAPGRQQPFPPGPLDEPLQVAELAVAEAAGDLLIRLAGLGQVQVLGDGVGERAAAERVVGEGAGGAYGGVAGVAQPDRKSGV